VRRLDRWRIALTPIHPTCCFHRGGNLEEYRAMKKQYLVVYDYGTGGVWALIAARSELEILQKYPDLEIVKERPQWMTDEYCSNILSKNSFDIDDEPRGWLSKT
jgi:hypothetical protein